MESGNLSTKRLTKDVYNVWTAVLILTTAILALRRWWQAILGIKTVLTILPELGVDSRNTTV